MRFYICSIRAAIIFHEILYIPVATHGHLTGNKINGKGQPTKAGRFELLSAAGRVLSCLIPLARLTPSHMNRQM
jgi:hypothetical protein